jgi:hypothetical protein
MAEFRTINSSRSTSLGTNPPLAVIEEPQRMNPRVLGWIALVAVIGLGLLSFGYVTRYESSSPDGGQDTQASTTPTTPPNQAPTPAQTMGAAPENPNSPAAQGTTGSGSSSGAGAQPPRTGAAAAPPAPAQPAPASGNGQPPVAPQQ